MKSIILISIFSILSSSIFGQFDQHTILEIPDQAAFNIFAEDLNNDGLPDIIACLEHEIIAYENLGNNEFAFHTIYARENSQFYSVDVADIDGDGLLDMASSSLLSGQIAWYKNLGNFDFSSIHILDNATRSRDVIIVDFDNDNDMDIIANYGNSHPNDDEIVIYRNHGDGTFAEKSLITNLASVVFSIFPFDIDEDGDQDLFITDLANQRIIMINNIDGYQTRAQNLFVGDIRGPQSIIIDDYNEDGNYDFIVASRNSGSSITLFSYLPDGSFSEPEIIRVNFNSWTDQYNTIVQNDIDGDGDLDLCLSDDRNGTISYLKYNEVDFDTQSVMVYPNATQASSVFMADLDNDGDDELLYSLEEGKEIGFFYNSFVSTNVADNIGLRMSIFPNPTSGLITLSNLENSSIQKLEIYNRDGHLVDKLMEAGDSRIDLTPYPSGLYFIYVHLNEGVYTEKVIKY